MPRAAQATQPDVEPISESRPELRKPPRKQLNMNPETLRMVDELLVQIQTYTRQKDTKASEMFHALVSALYEARDSLDFSDVRPRGKWGSPTARAFPVSLKNAFRSAIAWRHQQNG
jgi:hypothetical protein